MVQHLTAWVSISDYVVYEWVIKGDVSMEKKQMEVDAGQSAVGHVKERDKKSKWQKPKLEDVSGKVMAQPYIRFT